MKLACGSFETEFLPFYLAFPVYYFVENFDSYSLPSYSFMKRTAETPRKKDRSRNVFLYDC